MFTCFYPVKLDVKLFIFGSIYLIIMYMDINVYKSSIIENIYKRYTII